MQRPGREFKNAICPQFSRIGQAVSSPRGLERRDPICQGENTVAPPAQETGLSAADTSRHLPTRKASPLIEAAKEGLGVKFRLADNLVGAFGRMASPLADTLLTGRGTIRAKL